MAEIQRQARRDGDGYSSSMTWHDKVPPLESQEKAGEFIRNKDNGWYDDHAVRFLDYSNAKPTKKFDELKAKVEQLVADEKAYADAHSVHSFKAMHIGCPCCGSKLNKDFLTGERCPLCRTDLRAKTTIDKLAWYKAKRTELNEKIEAERRKQKDKAVVKWLVKYEYHS
jgi:hypothetical protein